MRRSYGAFARSGSSDYRFASVELSESQRRAFLDRAEEALHLAERARLTFEFSLTGDGVDPGGETDFRQNFALAVENARQ